MTPQADKAKSIFLDAAEMASDEERRSYVEAKCGDNAELRREVESLLHHHGQLESFLETPAGPVAATVDQPPAERPGTMIGRYKLLQEIGEGGMGVVYMAEQREPVRRKVALKVIKPGMDTKEVVARFEAERQALAMMDHPNIAKVYDGGATESGRPYFVMELVHGIPLTKYCDENQLAPRERLELFVQVCQAVQHAHQKGIIHRDIKPSNVMVTLHDHLAVPKIIDFGIAKATNRQLTEKTLWTAYGEMVGTPLYMSPEQAQMSGLDVDTRTDVYLLGVLLYELLTGTTPFDKERFRKASYDEIRRVIREEEPPRPSNMISTLGDTATAISAHRKTDPAKLSHLLKGELDWIVMKALEKDRTRRYESAAELARDVQRYLADEPVEACPPSAWYRLRKYARRRKGLLTTAALLAATMLVATAVSIGFAIQANAEKDKAVAAQGLADKRLAQSRLDFERALKALDTVVEEVSSAEFAQIPGVEKTRSEVLQRMLRLYEAIAEEHDDDPYARQQQALAYARISGILNLTGQPEEAEKAIKQGISILEELREANPDDKDHKVRLSELLFSRVHHWIRPRKERLKDAERALALREELVEPGSNEHIDRVGLLHLKVADLLAEDSPHVREHIADSIRIPEEHGVTPHWDSYIRLAQRAEKKGDFAEAEKNYRLGIEGCRSSAGTGFRVDRRLLSDNCSRFAKLLTSLGRFDEARTFRLESIEVARQLYREYGKLPHFGGILGARVLGYFQDARTEQQKDEAAALAGELIAEFPEVGSLYRTHAELLSALDDAEARLSAAIEEFPRQADYYLQRAKLFDGQNDLERALADYEAAVVIEPGNSRVQLTHASFIRSHLSPQQAISSFSRLIGEYPTSSTYYRYRGVVLRDLGRYDDALPDLNKAIELLCKDGDPRTYASRGMLFASMKQLDKSIADFGAAFELSGNSHLVGGCAVAMSRILSEEGEFEKALTVARLALEKTPNVHMVHVALCEARLGLHQYEEALSHTADAIALTPGEGWLYKRRAEAHFHLGHYDEALADIAKAVELNPEDLSALRWIALNDVAQCPDEQFRSGLLELADKAIQLNDKAPRAYAARGRILAAFGQEEKAFADLETAFDGILDVDDSGGLSLSSTCSELGHLCGVLAHRDETIPYLSKVTELLPKEPTVSNSLAWVLATCPGRAFWNANRTVELAEKAVELAEKAVELSPQTATYWNTLGVAHYRAGNSDKTIETLNRSMALRNGGDSFDWFFLAMAHWQRGEKDEARSWYGRAVEWMEKNKPDDEELGRFRDEAAELLGVIETAPEQEEKTGETSEEANEETTPPPATEDAATNEQPN